MADNIKKLKATLAQLRYRHERQCSCLKDLNPAFKSDGVLLQTLINCSTYQFTAFKKFGEYEFNKYIDLNLTYELLRKSEDYQSVAISLYAYFITRTIPIENLIQLLDSFDDDVAQLIVTRLIQFKNTCVLVKSSLDVSLHEINKDGKALWTNLEQACVAYDRVLKSSIIVGLKEDAKLPSIVKKKMKDKNHLLIEGLVDKRLADDIYFAKEDHKDYFIG